MIKPIIFGKFILLERISVGGMAEVYRAKLLNQPQFGRYFAIKRILPNLAKDEEFVSMFINEATVAVELEDPNVCQIYELGRLGQSHYIAMEYISGRDVAAIQSYYRRQKKIMSVSQACYITAQAAQGLDYAHKAVNSKTGQPLNLIHRDVSPQNLLVEFSGTVKLIDFGVAKASQKTTSTQSGVLKGKFSYMSPEQAANAPIDHRSDIFALGVIFWELLTGRRLFVSESEYAILEMIKECKIEKPSKFNPTIPDVVDRICMKALEKDPNNRYAWASDMLLDLHQFINSVKPPYTMWHLATWLQTTYADLYQEEQAKYELFETLNTEADVERYNQEHADLKEDAAVDKHGNIIPEISKEDASSAETFSSSDKANAPSLPPVPGRAKGDGAKSGEKVDIQQMEATRKAREKAESIDEFDPNVELVPEAVAPKKANPQQLRMERIARKNKQRKSLISVITITCSLIIITMTLVLTGVLSIPTTPTNVITDAELTLDIVNDVEAAKDAKVSVFNYPKSQDSKAVFSATGAKVTAPNLEPGRYIIEVAMDGFEPESFTLSVDKGKFESRIQMTHALPIVLDYEVEVTPENAHIYINDKLTDATGAKRTFQGTLDENYTVKAALAGYAPQTKSIRIEKDLKIAFTLEPKPLSFEIKSNARGTAFICVADDCKSQGAVPATFTFDTDNATGPISVEVRADNNRTWKKSIDPENKVDYKLFADFN